MCTITNTGIPGEGSVSKQVVSTTQLEDGSWRVIYRLVVTNDSDVVDYRYDLTDTLAFGAGITVKDATWAGDGRTGSFTAGVATIASGAEVPIDGAHSYLVTVNAVVTPAGIESGLSQCERDEESPASGFLNRATLSVPDGTTQDVEACSEPIHPIISKTPVSATWNAETGNWTVTYRVTVGARSDIPVGTNVDYSLTETPTVPASFALDGSWNASAEAGTPNPTQPAWDGTGDWSLVTHGTLSSSFPTHSYLITANLKRTTVAAEFERCVEGEEPGVAIRNTVTIVSGEYTDDAHACIPVQTRSVSLTKAAVLPDGLTSVEPGDSFRYDLVVTNEGSGVATEVVVTDDDFNSRLQIDSLSVTGDVTWGEAPGFTADGVNLTLQGLAPGASATISVFVTFLPPATPDAAPAGEAEVPDVVNDLNNTACVAMAGDEDATDNCGTAEVPTRDIVALLYTRCVNDAPLLGWTVHKSDALRDLPIQFSWTPDGATATTDPANVTLSAPAGTTEWTDEIEWPGAIFSPSGVSIGYPGWRPLVASDYTPDGGYYMPGTTTVMTSEQVLSNVFNGLILDDRTLDYSWRFDTTVVFSVNPELTFHATYPSATPTCSVPRHTELQIEKTASTEKAKAGDSIDYTIDVANVSEDSAAEGIVVTDAIPATLKVTDITWAGKGDAEAFPNWKDCAVADADAAGYGGTLTCELFGPLQPLGAKGESAAPTIELSATVAASAAGTDIVNTAVVDYHTFGDPDDSGRDSDDASTQILRGPGLVPGNPALSVTGADAPIMLGLGGLLIAMFGVALVLRRRREVKRG